MSIGVSIGMSKHMSMHMSVHMSIHMPTHTFIHSFTISERSASSIQWAHTRAYALMYHMPERMSVRMACSTCAEFEESVADGVVPKL